MPRFSLYTAIFLSTFSSADALVGTSSASCPTSYADSCEAMCAACNWVWTHRVHGVARPMFFFFRTALTADLEYSHRTEASSCERASKQRAVASDHRSVPRMFADEPGKGVSSFRFGTICTLPSVDDSTKTGHRRVTSLFSYDSCPEFLCKSERTARLEI